MGLGRSLIILGVILVVVGVVFAAGERWGGFFGKLPGDITWRGKSTVFYFPVVSCILLSVVLSLIFSFCRQR